ncbi:DUF4870 domain-containing protein [Streptomyces sp. NPDC058746]|uniref:DUF4870 domain-containing protein n=1 Tax=Streptomyces sp. NPDC058746 TaxID=3346622 RepID=UPI00368BF813
MLLLCWGGVLTCGVTSLLLWIPPLAMRGTHDPLRRQHATQALNSALTQLTLTIPALTLCCAVPIAGALVVLAYCVAWTVFAITAATAASERKPFRYPSLFAFPVLDERRTPANIVEQTVNPPLGPHKHSEPGSYSHHALSTHGICVVLNYRSMFAAMRRREVENKRSPGAPGQDFPAGAIAPAPLAT